MGDYYSDSDAYCAQWLRNLIEAGHLPTGDVDERSITEVRGGEVRHYTQAHFFAGIGGWPLALSLAGWPVDRSVWTGSCPCQPFSSAGKRAGEEDERHLWPAFFSLIRECRPDTVFGEQVSSKDGHRWLDGVRSDLEKEGYAVGIADLAAGSAGAPHARQRLFFVADSSATRRERREDSGASGGDASQGIRRGEFERGRVAGSVADNHGKRRSIGAEQDGEAEQRGQPASRRANAGGRGRVGSVGNTGSDGRNEGSELFCSGQPQPERTSEAGFWDEWEIVWCDERATGKGWVPRRTQPGLFPLASGFPFVLADGRTRNVSRPKVLSGIGNSIVPQVAAQFVKAFLETEAAT